MNDIRLDPSVAQPARKPDAIAAGFETHSDALDLAASFHGFVSPAVQQLEQSFWVRRERL